MALPVFLNSFDSRPAATDSAIAESQRQLGVQLPSEYVEFLGLADGGEGFVGEHQYLILWPVEELRSINEGYRVQEYVPGLLIFGSSGGGEAYGFDTRSLDWPIVRVPFVGMDWTLALSMGNSFQQFLQRLSDSQS